MRSEQEMVAYALEIDPSLLPYLPELLADLEELGSDAEQITEIIDDLALPAETHVVDLGCGKGAVAVEIAAELGFRVTGIELFEPFVDLCVQLAKDHQVADLCDFQFGNVVNLAAEVGHFDVAIFSALGDVLGPPDKTMAVVREYVRPGGFIIISDLYRRDHGANDFPGFEHYLNHDDTLALLTTHGDTLFRQEAAEEEDPADEREEELEEDEATLIRTRAQALAKKHPELKDAFMHFAAEQANENEFVAENFVDVVWVLRKS